MAWGLEVKGHIPHFQKREKGCAELWFYSFPFFGKHLEKAEFIAWKPTMFIKAKEKRSCLKPNDIVFFIFCHFWKIDPHFPSSLKACPSLSVLTLGLPPPLSSPLTTTCNPPTFHSLRLHPPHFQVLSKWLSFTLPPTHAPLHIMPID
jgi:hypothetical protein